MEESRILRPVFALSEKIVGFSRRVEAVPGKWMEAITLALYSVLHLVMAIFHEPWFDEAVAWNIARCASLPKILFEIPHYEGHPPLWHLILAPFAKLGAPYELSLTLISLVFAGGAVALLLFCSPFPRIVRILLPFNYFLFYQYGVISRPYCVMMLAFFLLAITWTARNEHPGRYVLCLMLLCLTSAYGIVIAGGLALVWVWEIWDKKHPISFVRTAVKDTRIWWLFLLLLLAVLLILEIMPREDAYAVASYESETETNNIAIRAIYMLFALLPDMLFSSLYSTNGFLKDTFFSTASLLSVCLAGCVLWLLIIVASRDRICFLTFSVSYVSFSVFGAKVYLCSHHTGIGLLILLFWLWINDGFWIKSNEAKELSVVLVSVFLFIPLIWSCVASFHEAKYIYSVGREEASFIAEHHLDNYNILSPWRIRYSDDFWFTINDEDEIEEEYIVENNTLYTIYTDNIAPYFEHNLFFNHYDGNDSKNYMVHRCPTEKENQENLEKWSHTIPDVLFGRPVLSMIYKDGQVSKKDYSIVYYSNIRMIWKTDIGDSIFLIYVRNDLLDELGLEAIPLDVALEVAE